MNIYTWNLYTLSFVYIKSIWIGFIIRLKEGKGLRWEFSVLVLSNFTLADLIFRNGIFAAEKLLVFFLNRTLTASCISCPARLAFISCSFGFNLMSFRFHVIEEVCWPICLLPTMMNIITVNGDDALSLLLLLFVCI